MPRSKPQIVVPGRFEPVSVEEYVARGGVPALVSTKVQAFIPDPLPPSFDLAQLHYEMYEPLMAAERALSLLEGTAGRLTNPHILIGPFATREAVLSSAIEDTVATPEELALFDANVCSKERRNEIREVHNYVQALNYGLVSELPISLRLIRELHNTLLTGGRGAKMLGLFRKTQNYIGSRERGIAEARFVPPPVPYLHDLLDNFEKYMHAPSPLPRLIQLALTHYQFEAIHPFDDGNGRVGRLLITLQLCRRAQLSRPLVYVSGYFERHRGDYYDLLYRVSTEGDWYAWIQFFLHAILSQAADAQRRAIKLLDLQADYHQRVQAPRASALLPALVDRLFERAVLTVKDVSELLSIRPPSAQGLINKLVDADIVREATGRPWRRAWLAYGILEIIREEYEPEELAPARLSD